MRYNQHIWRERKVPGEQSTSPLLSRSVSGHAIAYPFTSEILRINLTDGLVHSEILQGITFVSCNLIIVASFKNKYTFLLPKGKSKGKNHGLSPIFMLDEGEGMHDFTKARNKLIFSYAYKTEFFHLPKTFFFFIKL